MVAAEHGAVFFAFTNANDYRSETHQPMLRSLRIMMSAPGTIRPFSLRRSGA
ncbi:MAG: hypothetical protein RLZ98_3355, partial [Pseudomonadota bacterium]